MAQALLCVSQKPNFTYPILTDMEDCVEMLHDFGFQISGNVLVVMVMVVIVSIFRLTLLLSPHSQLKLYSVASSTSMMSSLCAAALALMNQKAPPLPPSSGGVFAVKVVLKVCTLLQAAIRRGHVQKNAAVLEQPETSSSGMRTGLLHRASA
jgi:hypothetical protein